MEMVTWDAGSVRKIRLGLCSDSANDDDLSVVVLFILYEHSKEENLEGEGGGVVYVGNY